MNDTVKNLVEKFIESSPLFFNNNELAFSDSKHKIIVDAANNSIRSISSDNFRSWAHQDDLDLPAFRSYKSLPASKIPYAISKFLYKSVFDFTNNLSCRRSIIDDLNIIKSMNFEQLLLENPVDLTPGISEYYKYDKFSLNQRWLRYIYLCGRILEFDYIKDQSVWLDVGSYYGGLQGLIRKYRPKCKIVMVDFHHQLLRSYIYLNQMYPDAQHVLPGQAIKYKNFQDLPESSITYLPVESFTQFSKSSVDLATNFFSFGEMTLDVFNSYLSSKAISEAKNLMTVNRFVSGPWFDKTYDTQLNILNYLTPERAINYFDIFPIHHFKLIKNNVMGRRALRNVSSSYFELHTTKNGIQ